MRGGITAALLILFSSACDPRSAPKEASSQPSAPAGTVVVYCSVDTQFARPILQSLATRTGLEIFPVFDTEAGKTTGLVNKLLAEKDRPRADVWWSSEIFGTMQLAAAGALEAHVPESAKDIPPPYRDPQERWVAFGLRGRVLAYDPRRTRREDLPRAWRDLAAERFSRRLAMADPRFGTTRGHMATLLALWGETDFEDYYAALKRNGCRITDGNSQSVLLLARGLVDLAATDTDDVIAAQLRGDSVDMIYPDLTSPRRDKAIPGTLAIPCSVALVRGAPHRAAARTVIEHLAGPEIEEALARSESRNTPVRLWLREKLRMPALPATEIDYSASAAVLRQADQLASDYLLP